MTADILCSRWTLLVIREMVGGRRHFNEMRRGLAGMSPGLLSKRLRHLEESGIIERTTTTDGSTLEYHLTAAGRDLQPIIEAFGIWGERWAHSQPTLRKPDAAALMWDIRRALLETPLPIRHGVILFVYPEQVAARRNWWILIDGAMIDVCSVDPGLAPDLYVVSDVRIMTAVWMGLARLTDEHHRGRVQFTGDAELANIVRTWMETETSVVEQGLPRVKADPGKRPAHP